jgi:hypothetical protein
MNQLHSVGMPKVCENHQLYPAWLPPHAGETCSLLCAWRWPSLVLGLLLGVRMEMACPAMAHASPSTQVGAVHGLLYCCVVVL